MYLIDSNCTKAMQSKRSFLISFFSCLLVVVVVSSLITIISNAPVVFLKMAEAEEGEIDARITSNQDDSTLNFTLIWDLVKDDKSYTYTSPRYHSKRIIHILLIMQKPSLCFHLAVKLVTKARIVKLQIV